jgi:ribosomal protein S18 acetylase RimI-like enzyme
MPRSSLESSTPTLLREYRSEDARPVARLLGGGDSALSIQATLGRWHAFCERPALTDSIVLAEAGDELRGLGWSMPERSLGVPGRQFRILVAREQRRKGIGSAILEWIEARAGNALELQCEVFPTWRAASGFLRLHEFEARPSLERMVSSSSAPEALGTPSLSPAYRLRTLDPAACAGTQASWCALHNRIFAQGLHFQPMQLVDARAMSGQEGFSFQWVENPDGRAVAYLHACIEAREAGSTGVIVELAVEAEHRRRGIARALLASTLAGFRERDILRCELYVEHDHHAAGSLYTGMGFRKEADLRSWRRARRPRSLLSPA